MTFSRTGSLVGLVLTGTLALTACGSDNNTPAAVGSPTASSTASSTGAPAGGISCATGSIKAAGSSAQKNAVDEWVKAYQTACSGATINYSPAGSGAGVASFISAQVDFAGSDSVLKDAEATKAAARCATGQAINLPMVVGPIAVAYKLEGVKDLILDATTIANIFAGKTATWDDAAIKALNPGVTLPSTKIQAFHRADESGTTDNFQKYLTAAAPKAWTSGAGKKFTGAGGQSASKSDGVTQAVKSTEGAVTYIEQSYAENAGLGIAKLSTGAATPVALTEGSAAKAVEAATIAGTGNDLKLKLDYATKAEGAYPLILVTYEIACETGTPAAALPLVKSFLTYTASPQGQAILTGLGYAPLPEMIRTKVATAVEAIK